MNNRFRFDAPSVADEEELDDQLVAYNLRKVPCRQGEPFVKFCRCAYNEKNELVGGVLACSILWNILSIESVWVAENYRGQGIAARLLKEVEEEAKAAGCYMAQLDTFDFQAPGFYEKQGYRCFGALEPCFGTHGQYFFCKEL